MVQLIGWLAALLVAGSYVLFEFDHKFAAVLTFANIVGGIILFPLYIITGSTFGAFLTSVFVAGAIVGIVRRHRGSRVPGEGHNLD